MATQIPQAGTRMSLISKADIRYEGVLSHIDMAKSEICLTQGIGEPSQSSFPAELAHNVQPPHHSTSHNTAKTAVCHP